MTELYRQCACESAGRCHWGKGEDEPKCFLPIEYADQIDKAIALLRRHRAEFIEEPRVVQLKERA